MLPRSIIFTIRGEYIEHFGILECGCLVRYVPRHKKGITRSCFELATRMLEYQVSADDIDHLLMRVTVKGSHPPFEHAMSNEHHARAIGHYLPAQ